METGLIVVIILKCIEILNHHVPHKELIQYIRYIIPQKQETNEHIKKERTDLPPGEMRHQSIEKANVGDLWFQDRTILFSEVDTLLPMDPF